MNNEFLQTEEAIVAMLKTVYDPEIPVNVYDLGLIYNIEVDDEKNVRIDMTLTAPNCPAADFILEDVRMKIESVDGVNNVEVNLVFEPEWDKDMMSEEAKLELGFYRDMDSLRKKYILHRTPIWAPVSIKTRLPLKRDWYAGWTASKTRQWRFIS